MRAITFLLIVAICFAGCLSCHRNPGASPSHIVFLIDVSASIEKTAEQEAFRAIADTITRARRGTLITVIPITGDAQTEVQGKILHVRPPSRREAYDQDRIRFAGQVKSLLERVQADALAHPGGKTDILGTIDVAGEEFAIDAPGTARVLVILSDFLQDDDALNFSAHDAMRSPACAQVLARQLARDKHLADGVRVFLGLLSSTDLKRLDHQRREAIQAFWREYFVADGSKPTTFTDGPAMLPDFLR